MKVLGIEATAHTCGVGIAESDPDDPERARVLANRVSMIRPEKGGIHPREAADHHVEDLPRLLHAALADARLSAADLQGIAFSQGPGLGPCLRTAATAARALALRHRLPLVGVNHCVAHLEIGRATTGARDPVLLYASGANTQVIAEARGRYRVFGETLDIGIGNALDKFAREQGLPFPGGPRIEELAAQGSAERASSRATLPELPYSVKGMDVAFSGTVHAAEALLRQGTSLPMVCHALQEWTFAMLTEVTERAIAHTGKDEVLLGGGVARNRRLQAMMRTMAEDRGASFHCPDPPLLSDNGAMIAWNGLLALRADHATPLDASFIDQKQRTDEIELVWRDARPLLAAARHAGPDGVVARGAEAEIRRTRFLGRAAVVKARLPKRYRDPVIERALVGARVRHETLLLQEARAAGAAVPAVLDADPSAGSLVLEELPGEPLREAVRRGPEGTGAAFVRLGAMVAGLHREGLVHGDLTTSNVQLTPDRRVFLLDFGLSERSAEPEARAVDLHVLQEALESTHEGSGPLWEAFLSGYRTWDGAERVLAQLSSLEARGRYMSASG